jgi:hypothetical protein
MCTHRLSNLKITPRIRTNIIFCTFHLALGAFWVGTCRRAVGPLPLAVTRSLGSTSCCRGSSTLSAGGYLWTWNLCVPCQRFIVPSRLLQADQIQMITGWRQDAKQKHLILMASQSDLATLRCHASTTLTALSARGAEYSRISGFHLTLSLSLLLLLFLLLLSLCYCIESS